jgi:hypothetical protein
MRQTVGAVTLAAALLANAARGQIGSNPAACSRQWGPPLSGQVGADGLGTLRFAAGPLSIELEFVSGSAQRAVYRAAALDDETVRRILAINSGGDEWHDYAQPGKDAADNGKRVWTRSEDTTMAELTDGVMTVVGSRWFQHLAAPPRPKTVEKLAPAGATPASNVVSSLAFPEPIVGFWRYTGADPPAVALHVQTNGTLSWVVSHSAARWAIDARWKRESLGGRSAYSLIETQPESEGKQASRIVGHIHVESSNLLRLRGEMAPGGLAAAARWGMRSLMEFQRIAAIPVWKPRPPAGLPVKGDTVQDAVRMLGKPRGTMRFGDREVLTYPWGSVWVADGVVVATE